MHPRWLLLVPAFLLLSCDDSKAPTEPAATTTDQVDAPSLTVVGFGSFWHDPHIRGAKIRTFAGSLDFPGQCTGTAKRFRSQDGAEIQTTSTSEGQCSYAGLYPADQRLRGRLLSEVKELDFSYAGGQAQGGSPRWSIGIDCRSSDGEVVGVATCYPDGKTDTDAAGNALFAFSDVNGCNDGDTNVGVLNGEDQAACAWFYNGTTFPNWAAMVAAYPGAKISRKDKTGTADEFYFIVLDQGPEHYLIFKVDAR